MAQERADIGSVRWVLEDLCRRYGHLEIGRMIGKKPRTMQAYCEPLNPRQISEADQYVIARTVFLRYGEPVYWPSLDPDRFSEGGTPEAHKRGMDDPATTYPLTRRAAR